MEAESQDVKNGSLVQSVEMRNSTALACVFIAMYYV
jgi:hypothetical protein